MPHHKAPYTTVSKNGNLLFWGCPVNTRSVKAGGKYLGQAGWENREVLGVRIDLNGLQLCTGAVELSSQRMGGSQGGGLRGRRKWARCKIQMLERVLWSQRQTAPTPLPSLHKHSEVATASNCLLVNQFMGPLQVELPADLVRVRVTNSASENVTDPCLSQCGS